jgi:hypothetical protein
MALTIFWLFRVIWCQIVPQVPQIVCEKEVLVSSPLSGKEADVVFHAGW